jgi:pyroglutamyl-peptidase
MPSGAVVMRHIPVSFELAPVRVLAKVAELRPPVVVCCGMAEGRTHLHLERCGKGQGETLASGLPLEALLADTYLSDISDDAGAYVCNHLYYRLLWAIAHQGWPTQALFVHVPPLTSATAPLLAQDLAKILARLGG